MSLDNGLCDSLLGDVGVKVRKQIGTGTRSFRRSLSAPTNCEHIALLSSPSALEMAIWFEWRFSILIFLLTKWRMAP